MILYLNLCSPRHQADGFEAMIRRKLPGTLEYMYNLDDLKKRIQTAIYDIDVLIIDVCQASPIQDIVALQKDLKDMNIILILNDITSNRQIEQLLKLYPRYMTFGPGDETIISVLKKRIQYKKGDHTGQKESLQQLSSGTR